MKKNNGEIELTIKQRKWLQIYVETGNATEAARQVYDCKNDDTARAIGSENLAKLNIAELMEEKGITDNRLMDKLSEGLDANSYDLIGKPHPNPSVRHKYLETALKLKKRLGNDTPSNPTNIQINLGEAINSARSERGL